MACSVGADNAESCNGLDDDCDSTTDEDFTTKGQSFDGSDSDQCLNGTYTCKADGTGVECVNEVPQDWPGYEESCNGLDDDCDAAIDEDFSTKGQACDGGDSDQCLNGTNTCKTDGSGVECVNENPSGIAETCNGLDDDCDGSIDEGVLNDCGSCGEVPPEICNGVDDDCDGETDEGNPGGGAECGETRRVPGSWSATKQVCLSHLAIDQTTVCDEADNDCDTNRRRRVVPPATTQSATVVAILSLARLTKQITNGWLNSYPCKPLLNESVRSRVRLQQPGRNVRYGQADQHDPQADLDVFVLSSCAASSCLNMATPLPPGVRRQTDYFVVVDGCKGASEARFQVTSKETTCNDTKDNDSDGSTDCATAIASASHYSQNFNRAGEPSASNDGLDYRAGGMYVTRTALPGSLFLFF